MLSGIENEVSKSKLIANNVESMGSNLPDLKINIMTKEEALNAVEKAIDKAYDKGKKSRIGRVSGSFSFEDMANFAVWIKDNFSDEIAGAFARRSDGNLYWDEQVGDLVKLWCVY